MDRFLRIYLQDQLAVGFAWRELARRAARNNRGSELGVACRRVATELAEDVDTLRALMRKLDITPDPVKSAFALAGERLGRLKFNGMLLGFSPLSRFYELELLATALESTKLLWITLRDQADLATRLPEVDFGELIERAERQRGELEPFRARAGAAALGPHAAEQAARASPSARGSDGTRREAK